jgi:hypothetical protein
VNVPGHPVPVEQRKRRVVVRSIVAGGTIMPIAMVFVTLVAVAAGWPGTVAHGFATTIVVVTGIASAGLAIKDQQPHTVNVKTVVATALLVSLVIRWTSDHPGLATTFTIPTVYMMGLSLVGRREDQRPQR